MEVKEVKKRKKEYDRKRYQNNKEEILKKRKEWYIKNKEKRKEYLKQYYIENRDILLSNNSKWYKSNRNIKNIYKRNKLKTNLKFNINEKISSGIRASLKGNKSGYHWEDLVGYTMTDLKKHLQKTVPDGYTWQDFMEGKLHIDHIIPKSVFNFTKPEHADFRNCWALENLQLLPSKENLSKQNKLKNIFD